MNYNKIDLNNYNLDSDFVSYIESFQSIYEHKILNISPSTNRTLHTKENNPITDKKDIKKILEDFFFTPRYNNVLDVLKFGNN